MIFLISFLLVFSSSYFIASVCTKCFYEHFAYLLLTAFSQLILTFEVLSLFSGINEQNVLILNVIFWLVAFVLWLKYKKPVLIPNCRQFFKRYINICRLDRTFIALTLCFLIFIGGVIFLVLTLPITNADAVDYHVARSVFYILNGSLAHFDVADVRILVFPFNSEIIYAWILLLLKHEALLGCLSFFGYIFAITSIYKFMRLVGFSLRKTVWSIFMVSSFASVIVQISGTETDILTASLILASITLFLLSFKHNKILNLFFSSLAYAIAVGTKTTAIIAIPAITLILLFLSFKNKNFKNFVLFSSLFILNFLVFSSYQYILNLIDYGSITGTNSAIVAHKNFYGLKGMIANFVRHIFLFFDFSGFKWGEYFGEFLLNLKLFILKLLHVASVPEGIYSKPKGTFQFNGTLLEPDMSFGILGFLVLLPCLLCSLIKYFVSKNFRSRLLSVLSLSYFIFIIVLSYTIVYMNYNCRFLAMFAVIASPVLSYSYFKNNNALKIIFVVFMSYYLVLVSSHLWARPWWHFAKSMIYDGETISNIRFRAACSTYDAPLGEIKDPYYYFWYKFKHNKSLKESKVLYFASSSTNHFRPAWQKFKKYTNVDFALVNNIDKYNIEDYDYIIFDSQSQYATFLVEKNIDQNYDVNGRQIKIYKRQSHYCFYISKDDKLVTFKQDLLLKDSPIGVRCFIDNEFLNSKNFKQISVLKNSDKFSGLKYPFIVYKNFNK